MPDPARPSIVLVEDHTLVRQLLAMVVREHLSADVVAEVVNIAEGLAAIKRLRPDLVVADWTLPDGDAAQLIRPLAALQPATRWLVISAREDETILRSAVGLGVHGIVLKQSPLETFRDAMRVILDGGTFYCPRSSRLIVESLRADSPLLGSPLTLRERDLLRGLAEGRNPKEMAETLGSSAKTVQNQLSQLKDKLGIREPAGLIRYARRQGIAPPEI